MKTLWVVGDVSGSMLEAGKNYIVRGLVYQIAHWFHLGYASGFTVRIVAFGAESRILDWEFGSEVPSDILQCAGSLGIDLPSRLKDISVDDRVVILTDGYWPENTRLAVRNWRSRIGPDALRVIRIGEDSDVNLKGPEVFVPEDFIQHMTEWFRA